MHREQWQRVTGNHVSVIERFYTAFAARDHASMAACLHRDIHFSDPVFPELRGPRVVAMWHMLCEQGTDLTLTVTDVTADADAGTAHWEPRYTFGPTGRAVHNRIDATFRFSDGAIIRHVDAFDLWAWSRMALGVTGIALGWSPMVRNKVRSTAARSLDRFVGDHPEYTT